MKKLTEKQEWLRVGYLFLGVGIMVYGGLGIIIGYFKLEIEPGYYLILSDGPSIYFGIAAIAIGAILVGLILKDWHSLTQKKKCLLKRQLLAEGRQNNNKTARMG